MLLRRAAPAASTCAVAGYVCGSTCSARRSLSTVTSTLPLSSHQCLCAPAASSSHGTPERTVASLDNRRRHSTTSATASFSASDDIPSDVLQRVAGRKQEMLRLLRLAAGHAAAPAEKMEGVFERHCGFVDTKAASTGNERAPSTTAAAWRTAVWRTLQLHCYFTLTVIENGRGGNAKDRVVSVVPFSWASTLCQVATQIPYEGWTEQELLARLRSNWPILKTYTPVWSTRYSGVNSLAQLVYRHFSSILTVTRSAVTGEVLYHRTGHNSVSVTWRASPDASAKTQAPSGAPGANEASAAVQYALHTLGRGHQLPVWTDVDQVAPLLSAQSGLADGRPSTWQEAFAKDAELRGTFQLEGYVRVRAIQDQQRFMAIVDCTSVSSAELRALLRQHPMRGGGVSVKLLLRDGMAPESHEAYAKTCKEALGPSTLIEDVLVDALLEPEHLFAALLEAVATDMARDVASAAQPAECTAVSEDVESEAPEKGGMLLPSSPLTPVPVIVLCGAASREAFAAVVADVPSSKVAITVLTPKPLAHT
ncbi:RESC17 [Leishmania donovani]|uniref:Hypothetical_protein_conserved n=1 Tax=Leishmania donovani TaxID=5661 RepID=A0A3S7WWF0_LEIDO|nr:hypothetical protein LdCL_210011600 [Leishmania donovani]CAJ1988534.1 RESC17 [Leishmania donovani]VDZ44415.1 hypothetical_protein_conserved [Leishmania donovani]